MTVVTPSMGIPAGLEDSVDLELERTIILNIFSSIGRCRFLEEKHFDACTALSGSGPAFACVFLEAIADGGVMMGLPRAEALELAAQSKSRIQHFLVTFLIRKSIARGSQNGFARWSTSRTD
jgi:pyrroline-5-carboxylate reductase